MTVLAHFTQVLYWEYHHLTGDFDKMAAKKSTRREWTKSDIRELKSLAKKVPARQIARKLRRSEGAVRQKAFVLRTSLGTRRRRRRK